MTTVFAAVAAYADTFVWTGKGELDSNYRQAFTNAANWKMLATGLPATRYPGMRYSSKDRDGSWASYYEHPCDEIRFGTLDGVAAQTIDLAGHGCVSNVFFDAGTTAYTFYQGPLGISVLGTITIDAGVETLPVFERGLGLGMGVTKAMGSGSLVNVMLVNNKAGSVLDLPAITSGAPDNADDTHYGNYYFRGVGGFRIGRVDSYSYMVNSEGTQSQYVHRALRFENEGKVAFYTSSIGGMSIWSYVRDISFDTTAESGEVEIEKNATMWVQDGQYQGFRFLKDYRIYGAGSIGLTGDRFVSSVWNPKYSTPFLVAAGKTVKVESQIAYRVDGSTYRYNMQFFGKTDDKTMTGTVDLTAVITNKTELTVDTHHPFTLKVAGIDGDPSVVSNAFGTSALRLSGGTTLAYAGPGETTVREIALTNAVGFSESGTTEAQATLSQHGTGKWTVSNFANGAASMKTATLTLDNGTEVDAELSAAVGNNAAGDRAADIVKTGSGKWILSGNNTTIGTLTVQGGEIEVSETGKTDGMTYDLADGTTLRFVGSGTRTLKQITARNGQSVVVLGTGTVAALNALPVSTGGGSVNFVLEGTATLSYVAGKGSFLPFYVTVNGKTVLVGGDGQIRPDDEPIVPTSAIPAKGGVITNDESIVGITTEGTTGPITLSAAQTAVDILVQKTETPATVSIGAGETLTAKSIIVEKDAGALTIGAEAGGTLAAASGAPFTLKNDSSSALTVTAPLTLPAGTQINKKGSGAVTLPGTGNWSADLSLSGSLNIGSLALASAAGNASGSVVVSGNDQSVSVGGGSVNLLGQSAAGGRTDIEVTSGTLEISNGANIETKSVKVAPSDGATGAKLVVTGGARVYFPETNGVFQIGAMAAGTPSASPSAATAELTVENGSIGAVFNPNHGKDHKFFANAQDRAVYVGGTKGDGILRVKAGGAVTNRLAVGNAYHCGAVYMDGGEIVSLGTDMNGGGDRYTNLGYGGGSSGTSAWKGGHGYVEQKGGSLKAMESLQVSAYNANGIYMLTGGSYWQGMHPDTPVGDGSSCYAQTTSTGAGIVYIGGDAVWESWCFAYMLDQGTGLCTFTVDGNARVSIKQARPTILHKTDRTKPTIINANGGLLDWNVLGPCYGVHQNAVYTDGVRTSCPAFFNLNGGVIKFDHYPNRELTPFINETAYPLFNRISVYEKGAEFCVTNDYPGVSAGEIYANIRCPIDGATGNGVMSVELDEPITGYIVPPTVEIEGDGFGASAVALFDSVTQTTTNILVTAHGYDYVNQPTAKLYVANTLVKTLPCTIAPNAAGPLTLTGKRNIHVYGPLRNIPAFIVNNSGWTLFRNDDSIRAETTLTIKNGGNVGFGNGGGTYANCRPYVIRGEADGGRLGARSDKTYVTQAVAIDGSANVDFNSQTNLIVGCTKVNCATLVANKAAGIVPLLDYLNLKGVIFDTTATMAFSNVEVLDPAARYYPICKLSQTRASSTHVFTGLPTPTGLPEGWYLKQVAGELRLKKIKGLAVIVR